jgi:hypothetical protein
MCRAVTTALVSQAAPGVTAPVSYAIITKLFSIARVRASSADCSLAVRNQSLTD